MNILLLEADEVGLRLDRGDRRYEHVRKVLKKGIGDNLAAGIVDGPKGRASVRELDEKGMILDFEAASPTEPEAASTRGLAPLRLLLGFPRPIQATRIFKDLSSLGVAEILLSGTELGEKSYLQSDFFRERQWRRALIEGAEQAGCTQLPTVSTHWTLDRCLADLGDSDADPGTRVALHPKGESRGLLSIEDMRAPVTIAVGSERGWTEAEMGMLLHAGFLPATLGNRILKTETAALAASVLALARLGYL